MTNEQMEAQHRAWLSAKQAQGWVYGTELDTEKKIDPCIAPYHQLSAEQKARNYAAELMPQDAAQGQGEQSAPPAPTSEPAAAPESAAPKEVFPTEA